MFKYVRLSADLPVKSLNSIAMDKIRAMRGSEVESVRMAKDSVSMLLRNIDEYVCGKEAAKQ